MPDKEEIPRPKGCENRIQTAYTVEEAAAILHMSNKSVRRQIDRGNLRKCKVFGRVLIPRKDVDTFMEKFSAFAV